MFSIPSHTYILSFHSVHFGISICIQCCLTSQAHFPYTLSCMFECQWPTGWHQLSRLQMPKPVTHPSSQVFHPIYLSLLPMTRLEEMDTETLLNIDSGSCNSQARSGLSPASSFHFLYVRERETARDWARDNVSRQKSIFCFHLLTLSKSIIFGQSKCLLWQQGAWVSKEKSQINHGLDQKGSYVDLPKCYSPLSVRKFEECLERVV